MPNERFTNLPKCFWTANQQLMKRFAFCSALLGLMTVAVLAEDTATNSTAGASPSPKPALTIPATAAKDHMNKEAVVTGTIVEVHQSASAVHLNFEKPFPDAPFTAVIFANKTNLFQGIENLKGKKVEVSGMIAEYRKKPEIILTRPDQLKVLEKVAAPATAEK